MRSIVRYGLLLALLSLGAGVVAQPALPPPLVAVRDAIRARTFEVAIERGEAAVAALPDNTLAWLLLGQAYAAQAQTAGLLSRAKWARLSLKALQRAAQVDPRSPEALFALMQYYAMAPGFVGGDADLARELADELAALDVAWGHMATGQIALSIDEDKGAAERAYLAALKADPDSLRARQALGGLYAGDERWSDARALWDAQLQRKPDDAFAIYAIGRLAAISGEDLERGLAMLDRYLALPEKAADIGEAPAHWRRGLVLEKLARRDEAIAAIRRGLALDPHLADAKADLNRIQD